MGLFSFTAGRRSMRHSLRKRFPDLKSTKRKFMIKDPDFNKARKSGFSRLERRGLGHKWSSGGSDPFSRRSSHRISKGLKGL